MSLKSLVNKDRKFVSKPWGYEDWLCNGPLYCGKELFVKGGKRLSIHYHKMKTETFFVNSGSIVVNVYTDPKYDTIFTSWDSFHKFMEKVDEKNAVVETIYLGEGDTFTIPIGTRHTIFAARDARFFEFSTQHFDEDSYRILIGG